MLFTLWTTGCQPRQVDPKAILGSWENTALKVKMNTYQSTDTVRWLVAPEGKWEEVLKIKPIKTTYFEDGTFRSEYKNLDDQPIGTEEGKWLLSGDSLRLFSPQYNYSYKLYLANDRIRFVALVDWDNDGEADDLYDGWQVRVDH